MRNFTTLVPTFVPTLAAAMMLLGIAQAQDAAAAKPAAPAAKTSTTPVAKAKTPATKAAPAKTPATGAKSAAVTVLKTKEEKFSYALGMNLGMSLHQQSVEVDPNLVAQGLKSALAGGKTLLTPQEAQAALAEVQTELQKKRQEKMQAASEANKKEGDTFLTANKGKEGVVTLPSGLQYKILTAGTGPKPTASDTVVCNYKGTFIDGKEFDSSYKTGNPATFPVGGVIKGWTEALQLMPVGSKWQLFIPSNLAYGERGSPGGQIGPGATLIFEVELMSIQEKAAEKAPDKPQTEEKK